MTKKFIEDKFYLGEGTYDISNLEELLGKYQNATLVYHVDYDYTSLYILYSREENDKEYKARIMKEEKATKKIQIEKEKRRKLYEKLKKEFEND